MVVEKPSVFNGDQAVTSSTFIEVRSPSKPLGLLQLHQELFEPNQTEQDYLEQEGAAEEKVGSTLG